MHLDKIKKILLEPTKFFSSLKEKSLQDAFLYYIILSAFSVIMSYIMFLLFGNIFTKMIFNMLKLNMPMQEFGTLRMFGQFVLGYIFAVLGSFVGAGFLFVWLLIFGGNKGYNKTYQLMVYSQTPSLLFKWIPFLGIFASIYSFVLLIIGTKKIYNFTTARAVLIYLIPLILVFIIALAFVSLGLLAMLKSGTSLY
ncbi:MAG: YIP1 family protein [Nanoarchaeota archaeon]